MAAMTGSKESTGDIMMSRAYMLSASTMALDCRRNKRLCSLHTLPLEHHESVVTLSECEVRNRSLGQDRNFLRILDISVEVTGRLVFFL